MRWWWLFLILVLLRAKAQAADAPPTRKPAQQNAAVVADTVQAATNKAVSNLYDAIAPLPLSPAQTVGQYLKANDLESEFLVALRHADQIGGPRWIDEYTAQVRLEIPVARVTYALKQYAASRPRTSPPPDQIERISKDWPRQVIGATGSSTSSERLANLRPPSGPWRDVPEKVREEALEEARGDAVENAMKSVDRVRINPEKTLGDAFVVPEIGKTVGDWLAGRPVTEVDFDQTSGGSRQKLVVKVSLGVDPEEYFGQVRSALERQQAISPPKSEEEWERVRQDFLAAFRGAVGRATAKVEPPGTGVKPRVNTLVPLVRQAPTWVNDDVPVEGTASAGGTTAAAKLRARQKAEAEARDALWDRIELLQLDNGVTVGQAMKRDPRLAAAVRRAIDRTRPTKTEYRSDGTVVVRMVYELRDVWDEVRRF